MDGIKSFLVLRYSLIENGQGALNAKILTDPKGAVVLSAISDGREFHCNGVTYSFVGFSFVKPSGGNDFPVGRFLLGKTAKLRYAHVGEKIPGDIVEHKADDWVPVITVIDIVEQYIFVQQDWRFGTSSQICRSLQAGLRSPVLDEYNYLLYVEPKLQEGGFWTVINDHSKIYKVDLDLISPNILETNIKARESLAALKLLFGQDGVAIKLYNGNGNLKVPVNPISNYVDYIEEGEGSWSVTTEGVRGGKKTHKSFETAMTVDLEVSASVDAWDDRQLELHAAPPTHDRLDSDARLVADVYSAVGALLRR